MKKQFMELVMVVLLLLSMLFLSREAAEYVMNNRVVQSNAIKTVVIDAGHGGDPGKVGINGVLEKDINLAIARRVKELLEANNITVVMTRDHDGGLYEPQDAQKKVRDMKKRIEIIDEADPDLVVSIHQNSYPEESISGAQVFFYTNSTESKKIAQLMQQQLIQRVDQKNTRVAKANSSYYLLKKTAAPIIIVECGFLSNWVEAELLATTEYQEKVAWAIHMGILTYLNKES